MPDDPRVGIAPKKTAVVLFNLGGPDRPQAIRPFLFNLFRDKAIIRLPFFLRYPLAWLIARSRAKTAAGIYAQMGGQSPIVAQTRLQADALEKALETEGDFSVFFAMRYWHPFSREVVREVKDYAPDKVILLPLYPQFSTTTTASSLQDWRKAARAAGLKAETASVCCYPTQIDVVASYAELIRRHYWEAADEQKPRLLFSAHGLPEKIVAGGDPYQWQVEQTVAAIVNLLAIDALDYRVCYQSRVGRLQWIGPSTEEEIERAGRDGASLLVVPVSFVSEHSETLVELDIEYRHLAESCGVTSYRRVPAPGVENHFIQGLKTLCLSMREAEGTCSATARRLCPRGFTGCPMEHEHAA